jgi:hypothetical protein
MHPDAPVIDGGVLNILGACRSLGRAVGRNICLYLDPSRFLRWHQWLASALSDTKNSQVCFIFAPTAHPLPRSCLLAMQLERMIYGLHNNHAIDQLETPGRTALAMADDGSNAIFDVVIDLAGHGRQLPACRRVLTPLFNSVPGELGAIAALLDDGPLRIAVHDSASMTELISAHPAMSDPQVFVRALDGVLSRTVELIIKALDESLDSLACNDNCQPRRNARPVIIPAFPSEMARVTRVLAEKITRRIGEIATGGNTWAVAYRFDDGSPLLDTRCAAFLLMQDDARRYYADPFPFQHNGQHFIFVEEFLFETQRGCISVAAVDKRGMVSRPRIILEETHHLSFPFVFEHDGHIWMIPESADCGRIDLYRAEDFPYRWRREGSLLEGIAAYDATLLRRDDGFWLLASLGRWQSTSWDNLSIFHAKNLKGPWTPHARNPVLLHAMHCRAAGAPFHRNGHLLRPAQDCSYIYGGAITLNRVDQLSETAFRQTAVGRIECGTPGCHTYNRHGGLEVIDIFAPTRRLTHVTAAYTPMPSLSCGMARTTSF